ncbi:MAG: hypothetical protein IJI52_05440, partial [Solobacterium sp.]|nr:hypothetical protein [Solobacterium sp.]
LFLLLSDRIVYFLDTLIPVSGFILYELALPGQRFSESCTYVQNIPPFLPDCTDNRVIFLKFYSSAKAITV